MRVLTWNLYHGRSIPGAGRDLQREFAAALAGWDWDVALLQEVPPWWAARLGHACNASARSVLTSRNLLAGARAALARRAPDVLRANGGGANVILVRGHRIDEHRSVVLRRLPERRVAHAVRLGGGWVGNLHGQGDICGHHAEAAAQDDLRAAAAAIQGWAGDATSPVVLGGDTNTLHPAAPGLSVVGGHDVDFVLARGMVAALPVEVLERGTLSDHAPVRAVLQRA